VNLASTLLDGERVHPDTTALAAEGLEYSYKTIARVSAEVAGLLRARGVGPGDRVGMMLPNVPHFAAIYYGILRLGAVVVPMNPLLRARETAHLVTDSGAVAVFAWHDAPGEIPAGAIVVRPGDFEEMLAEAPPLAAVEDRRDDDTAVILYTSGTTGAPKGAELTHANLLRNAELCADVSGLGPATVTLAALPLFHAFGQTCALNATLLVGGRVTLMRRFDGAGALAQIEHEGVTALLGVPTMYAAMAHHPDVATRDLSSLAVCTSGGAAMPVELLHEVEARFGCVVLEGYGLSETSPTATFNTRGRPRKAGSVGRPLRGVEIRVADDDGRALEVGAVGEVLIRGHNVMKGYWGRPEATREAIDADGWFRSGDLGRFDADGDLFIVGRAKEMIIRGGFNVYPREIEEVLHEHPAVEEAAVFGIPHPDLGEEVVAVVAARAGGAVAPEELVAYVKARVAAYKYPRRVRVLAALPKGPTGKILKRDLVGVMDDAPPLVPDDGAPSTDATPSAG
jgi:long-chain acyl-CoA synthetase